MFYLSILVVLLINIHINIIIGFSMKQLPSKSFYNNKSNQLLSRIESRNTFSLNAIKQNFIIWDQLATSFQSLFQWNRQNNLINKSSKVMEHEINESYLTSSKTSNPNNAILVFGSTGKLGVELIKKLIEFNNKNPLQSRDIVLVGRNTSKLMSLYETTFLEANHLFVYKNPVDVLKPSKEVFQGVSQVISLIGPGFDSQSTSEIVDFQGNVALIESVSKYIPSNIYGISTSQIKLSKEKRNIKHWKAIDDVIMGGKSQSKWIEIDWNGEGNSFLRWCGLVNTNGGGFASTTNIASEGTFSIDGYDGLKLRVRGDGKRYKLRLRPVETTSPSEYKYQASFDTIKDAWMDVTIPFDNFVPVLRNDVLYTSSDHKIPSIVQFGLVLSRFEYNELPNPRFYDEDNHLEEIIPFQFDLAEVKLYKSPRPSFVLISSAGTERINRLEVDDIQNDVPIVKLNPLGILNWKYKAETMLRATSLPYTIVRSTGLVPSGSIEESERPVSFSQGDVIAGRITRAELSNALISILSSSYAVRKTFEIRRDDNDLIPIVTMKYRNIHQDLKSLIRDDERSIYGLPPFPYAKDIPRPAPSKEEVKEILNDPRVKQVQERDIKYGETIPKDLQSPSLK